MHASPTGKKYESHIKYSETGNPLTKFVNLCQTPEERRDKYAFCRFYGLSVYFAAILRDWHWTKLNEFIKAYLTIGCQLRLGLASDQPEPSITST